MPQFAEEAVVSKENPKWREIENTDGMIRDASLAKNRPTKSARWLFIFMKGLEPAAAA